MTRVAFLIYASPPFLSIQARRALATPPGVRLLAGPFIPIDDPNCANRDLDGDGDIDQSDYGIFQRCFSGPDVEGNPDCAG
jgi:hypothetical protein